MLQRLSNFIAADSKLFAILLLLLIAVIIIMLVRSSFHRKKILKLSPNKPGDILELEDGDHIVVSPCATLIDLRTNEKFKVYQVLDRIWKDVGKQLCSFYTHPFEINFKISDLKKDSNGYSIIVSDKNENLYKLETKHLPRNYTVKIHVNSTENSGAEDAE